MQIEQSIVDDVDGITGVWEYFNTEGRNKLNADTTPNSNLHIRKSDDHWYCSRFKDCHPQMLKSGISIEVLGDNGTSVRVKTNVDEEYRVNVLDNVKFTDVFPDINFCNAIFDNMKKKDGLKRTPDSMMTIRDWATISAIDDLQMDGYGIKDLTGIEYFPLLDWLVCNNNEIKELTPEQVPNMIFLDCSNNQLTELDLSQWPQLEYLFCDDNQLTELDVSNNERLYSFTFSNNLLRSIDLSKNSELWELDCSNNKLSNIDITNNPDLAILKCHENFLDTETPANTILGLDAVLEEIGEALSKDDPDNWFAYYPQKIAEPSPTPTGKPSPTPTVEPTVSPVPTAEPSPTLTAEPDEKQCVKIIAEYDDNGALKNIKTETINISDAVRTDNSRNIKTFYWESLDSIKPICEQ